MFTLLDPITADLFFTLATSLGLIVAGAATIAALPWTTAEISATEKAFASLLPVPDPAAQRIRAAR
jgi:hypothetical protein